MPAEACKPSNTKEKRNTLSKMNHQQALKRVRLYLYKMQARDPQIQQCVAWGFRGLSNKDIKEAGQWQRKKARKRNHVARPLAVDVPRPSVAIRANWGLTRLTARWGPTPCSGSGVSASCQTHCGQWHNRFCFNLGEPPTNQSAEVPGYLNPFRAHRLETDDDVYDDNRQTLSRPVQPPACQRAVQLQLQDHGGRKGKGPTRLAARMQA